MKKIVFSIISSMLIGICAVQAQQDETTGTASKSKEQKQKSQQTQQRDKSGKDQSRSWQQQSDRSQGQDSWANEGMVIIEKEQIPSSLKQTLEDEKYSGWKNATIYHNTTTGEYVIAPRAYRFDGQGKEVEMTDADRMEYRQGRSSRYSNGDYSDRSKQQKNSQGQARDQVGETPPGATQDQPNKEQSGDDQSTATDQSTNDNQSTDQSSRDQSDNSQSTQDQTDNTSATPSGQQPSSGYRPGQDSQKSDGTQNNSSTQSQSGQGTRDDQ